MSPLSAETLPATLTLACDAETETGGGGCSEGSRHRECLFVSHPHAVVRWPQGCTSRWGCSPVPPRPHHLRAPGAVRSHLQRIRGAHGPPASSLLEGSRPWHIGFQIVNPELLEQHSVQGTLTPRMSAQGWNWGARRHGPRGKLGQASDMLPSTDVFRPRKTCPP